MIWKGANKHVEQILDECELQNIIVVCTFHNLCRFLSLFTDHNYIIIFFLPDCIESHLFAFSDTKIWSLEIWSRLEDFAYYTKQINNNNHNNSNNNNNYQKGIEVEI